MSPLHHGTHLSHFYSLKINIFNTQSINLRSDLKKDYELLQRDMLDEVDNLHIKLTQNLNIQKKCI